MKVDTPAIIPETSTANMNPRVPAVATKPNNDGETVNVCFRLESKAPRIWKAVASTLTKKNIATVHSRRSSASTPLTIRNPVH